MTDACITRPDINHGIRLISDRNISAAYIRTVAHEIVDMVIDKEVIAMEFK